MIFNIYITIDDIKRNWEGVGILCLLLASQKTSKEMQRHVNSANL